MKNFVFTYILNVPGQNKQFFPNTLVYLYIWAASEFKANFRLSKHDLRSIVVYTTVQSKENILMWTQAALPKALCSPTVGLSTSRKHAYIILTPLNPTFI